MKPEASPEEVKAVVDDDQGGQIFSQALMSSNRYGEARSAYREVQERHADIKKIEKTLTELAQLFNDVGDMKWNSQLCLITLCPIDEYFGRTAG